MKSPAITAPFGACTRMPASAAAPDCARPRRAPPCATRMRDACGLRYSAHGLGRGKRARSTTITSTPRGRARARSRTRRTTTDDQDVRVTMHELYRPSRRARRPPAIAAHEVHEVVVDPCHPAKRPRRAPTVVRLPLGFHGATVAPEPGLYGRAEQGIDQRPR